MVSPVGRRYTSASFAAFGPSKLIAICYGTTDYAHHTPRIFPEEIFMRISV